MTNKGGELKKLGDHQTTKMVQSEDFNLIMAMAAEIGNAKTVALHVFVENELQLVSIYGSSEGVTSNDYLTLTAPVISSKKKVFVPDIQKEALLGELPLLDKGMPLASYAGFPILETENHVVGVLSLLAIKSNSLSDYQIKLLEKLAAQTFEIIVLKNKQYDLNKQNNVAEVSAKVLEMLNDVNGIAYWVYDIPTGMFSNSNKVYEIHEVPTDHVFDITNTLEFYHSDYHSLVLEARKNIVEKGIPFDYVALLITAKGNERWVRSIGTKLDHQIIGSFQDITDLKQRELKFEGIFNSTLSFVAFLNKEGVLLELNETALQASETHRKEVIGLTFWDLPIWNQGAQIQLEVQDSFKKALAGEQQVYEVDITIANGKKTTILFSLRPLFNEHNEVLFVIAEGRPIDKLVQTRDRYKAILEATSPGTWEWDIENEVVVFDELWVGMLGYTLEELSPISFKTWEVLVHPDDLPLANERLKLCFERIEEFYEVEIRMKHKNGDWMWIRSYGRVMEWTSAGKPGKMYGAHLDITQEKKEQQRVKKLLDLTQKQNERLKNFAHIVSHNLRSHSTSMSGLLNLIMHETPEIPDNELIKMLAKNSENLNQTVEDLTNVVKASMQDDLVKDVYVSDAIERNIQSLFSKIKIAEITITNHVDSTLTVKGIQSYIDSVFLNFISNAIKYRSTERTSYLKIYSETNSTHVIISFEDNGQGINLKKHGRKLFGMYKTFHKHEDSRGVGLFITKSQVESMGGYIEVNSTENRGTTFKVYLPFK